MNLLAVRLSIREIGQRLSLADETMHNYLSNLCTSSGLPAALRPSCCGWASVLAVQR